MFQTVCGGTCSIILNILIILIFVYRAIAIVNFNLYNVKITNIFYNLKDESPIDLSEYG